MSLEEVPERGTCQLQRPCRWCGGTDGVWEMRSGQAVESCASCDTPTGRNVPKTELGLPQRSLTRRGDCVKPKQRQRIFARDGYRCLLCGQAPPLVILTAGHILSHKDGELLGLPETQIDSDANLMTMCEPCNSGLGRQSLEHWLAVALLNRPRNGP